MLRQINSRILRRAPIFARCDRALVGALCAVLRRVVFVTGEVIAREGEVVRELLFLEHGRVIQAMAADSEAANSMASATLSSADAGADASI